jgi:hypothetical protein
VLAAVLLARLPSLWEPRWALDEGGLAAVGTEMLHGQRLYVDVWDGGQPLAYAWMAGVVGVTRGWHPGMQLVLALQVLIATACAFAIARRLGGRPALTGLVFGLALALPVIDGDLQGVEAIGLPALCGAVLLGIGGGPLRALLSGALAVAAGLCHPTYLIDALCIPWYVTLSGRPLRLLPLLTGGAAAALLAAAALWLEGGWAAYAGVLESERTVLTWANGGLELAPIALFFRLGPIAIGVLAGLRIGIEQRTPAARLLGAWLPLATAAAVLDPLGRMHQAIELLPPLALLLGLWLRPILLAPVLVGTVLALQFCLFLPRVEMFALARWPAPGFESGTAFGWTALPAYYRAWYDRALGATTWTEYASGFPGHPPQQEELAASLRVEGRIVVWGDLPWLYVETGREQAGPYVRHDLAYHLRKGSAAESVAAVRRERPEYVVTAEAPPRDLGRLLASQYDRLRFLRFPWPVYGLHSG